MNIFKKSVAALILFVITSTACDLHAAVPAPVMNQSITESPSSVNVQSIYPNMHGKSLTTPVAWGAGYGDVFFGAGAVSRAQYIHGPAFSNHVGDGAVAAGFGLGNPVDNLGLQTILTQYDVTGFNNWGMSFQLHHYLNSSQAVAVGVQEVMLSSSTNNEKSFYFVYSQGVTAKPFVNQTTGTTRLHYSIGVGNGKYGNKSSDDLIAGKGTHGTYVFGNVAYELFNEFNVIADWSGLNLNAGVSKTFFITKAIPVSITLGAVDLTGYTGDGVRMVVGVGTGITL